MGKSLLFKKFQPARDNLLIESFFLPEIENPSTMETLSTEISINITIEAICLQFVEI